MKQAQESPTNSTMSQNGNDTFRNSKVPLYCYNCNAESSVVPLRHCSKCKEKHVNEEILYCSAECQTDDWPNHKTRCGRDAPRYNALEDTGFILGNSAANAGGRNLRELNIVYRRVILWAVRQAYAANHADPEKQYLVLNFAQQPEHGTVLHSTHFQSFEDSPAASKVLHAPISIVQNKNPIQKAFCCTRLSGIEVFIFTPLCYQERDDIKGPRITPDILCVPVEMRKHPVPRWPWILTTFLTSGIRSPYMIDQCLSSSIFARAVQEPGIPDLGRDPWVVPVTSSFFAASAAHNAKVRLLAASLGIAV